MNAPVDMTARNQRYREMEARRGWELRPLDGTAWKLIRECETILRCKEILREQYSMWPSHQDPVLIADTKQELIAADRRYRELCAQVWPLPQEATR